MGYLAAMVLILVVVLAPVVSIAAPACTHYISANGTGPGTQMKPMSLKAFWDAAPPGAVGCLEPGKYGDLKPPKSKVFAGAKITLREPGKPDRTYP